MCILFLDFDGCTHSAYGRNPKWSRVPFIAAAIASFPEVQIVISSSWREHYLIEKLRAMLGPLGDRVIGVTPLHRNDYGRVRQREIEAWMVTNRPPGTPFVALDDEPALFEKDCPWVIFCPPRVGFDGAAATELRRRLLAR